MNAPTRRWCDEPELDRCNAVPASHDPTPRYHKSTNTSRVFVSYHWGVREPQQEAKPPDGRARLARGLEALLRQEVKPPQARTIVPASPPSSRQRKPRHPP